MVKLDGKRKILNENGKHDDHNDGWKVTNSYEGPSRKMSKLDKWIESDFDDQKEKSTILQNSDEEITLNQTIVSDEFMKEFAKCFDEKKSFKLKNKIKLYNEPFQAAVIKNFLSDESVIEKLVEEIEQQEWTRKQMDLYEFYQTTDLANIKSPYLSKFYNFINNNVREWMEKLTEMKFQRASASCSMYNCGDFLLSHDDLLSDRLVAFVFYLSPWANKKTWNESMGGALELFTCDNDGQPKFPPVEKIFPSSNQLAFFKVEKRSHHQVGEVLTKDYPRLTINGWFHGFKDNIDYDADAVKIKRPNVPIFKTPNNDSYEIENIINRNYLKDKIKKEIQKQIEENSEAGLGEFLKNQFLIEIENELKGPKLKWIQKGPANQQNYEILDKNSLPKSSHLGKLIDLVASKQFFKLLYDYTELDLHGKNAKNPKCTVEFQRWKRGCYTLINDPSTYNYDCLDLLYFIGTNESIGTTTYLTPEGKQEDESVVSSEFENGQDDDDDSVLLTIYPQNNFVNLVYRSSGTTRFMKYCYKSAIIENEYYRLLSTISYILVIFVIGVPMWWKTTEIHRADLPSNDIEALDDKPITFSIEIGIFINNDERQKEFIDELEVYFRNNDIFGAKLIPIKLTDMEFVNIKTPAKLEQILNKHYEIKAGNLLVAEWKNLEEEILVTNERTIFISPKASSDKIYQVVRSWIVRDYKIRSILGQIKSFDGKQIRHKYPPPSPEYEIMISVLNPNPDLQTLHWNVRKATEMYLQPFLNELSDLSNFTLKSQWKYQVVLKYDNKQIKDESKMGRHFAMEKDSLPQIINSIERKLGTDVVNKPCIHLVVYAPPCKFAPVYVYKDGSRISDHSFDSFISAKWGGIVIANPSDAVCSSQSDESNNPQEIYLHSHEVMDFVLYQLRKIFELQVEIPLNYASMVSLEQITPRLWEKDMYLRNGAIHLIASASSTLKSLIKLLDDIKNIVIGDHVGAEIHTAYKNVVLAKEFLATNDIHNAVKHARLSFIAAEKAFNDPSLLELLYFPEEQKYAIYIPLYLPIMIPVFFSFKAIKKYFTKSKEEETVESNDNVESKKDD
ncbi:hypothetical protein PVAND_000656 [Polypedilum vanderplanki]|uniref:uS12 prolyl 3-hydroxylase n=1 Tax=Polypedilum vanderplanki TaxID=319348 RepID=A0A9J6BLN9_POLVA|nr:hypothetical protein PVAND_000656 [Polypedilum vanderplanki]